MDNQKEFKLYEYKKINVDMDRMSFVIDSYKNFGWVPDENIPGQSELYEHAIRSGNRKVTLRMKRNRNLINIVELTRLQRYFDSCMKEIEMMETRKELKPTIISCIVGIIGIAFITGSVFAITASTPMVLLMILLAIPGFAGCIISYFLFRYLVKKQEELLQPLIDEKYNEITEICKKGYQLMV